MMFVGVCYLILVAVSPSVSIIQGAYDIESVTLSSDLKDNQPLDIKDVFRPSDTIICTVKTTGIEGVIGMRWFFGDKMVYEVKGRTQNNTISSYIKSNSSSILLEGPYRVEIFVTNKPEPLETLHFEVKIYHPTINPPISIPNGHQSIELPWFPEVPFAFDETWKIGDTEWKVNEVKIVLMDDTQEYFVAIVIDTDMSNIASLIESEAKEITSPIALYALENGYIEKAKSFEIDGQYYDLDQSIFVILINPATHQVYRVQFTMAELK